MSYQLELQKQFREQQQKFTYYIIALCIAAIAFSVNSTATSKLIRIHIPLAIAVFSWSISVLTGLMFLRYSLSIMYANNQYFVIRDGDDKSIGTNRELINAALTGVKSAIEINQSRASSYSKWQWRSFFIGMLFFLFWHILRMSEN